MVMRWEPPVFVGSGNQLTGTVVGPSQAIEYMKSHFHCKRRRDFRKRLDGLS
jgi:hypothetical protein